MSTPYNLASVSCLVVQSRDGLFPMSTDFTKGNFTDFHFLYEFSKKKKRAAMKNTSAGFPVFGTK